MHHIRRRSTARTAGLALAIAAAAAAPAAADITEYPEDPTATPLAEAIASDPDVVVRGVFPTLPPSSKPAAVSTTRLAGFPRTGRSFAILSTGNARYADDPDEAPDTGSESRGPAVRGARDVVMLRVDLRVPRKANCLSFRFRFLSEEYPEFVDDVFNDAFVAELDKSTWDASGKADPAVTSPRNFASVANGDPIRINTAGVGSMTKGRARGTTYDGATRILRASTRVTPGRHRLYLSLFDQGDRAYDSAVFVDQLVVGRRSKCRTGVVADG